MREYVINKNSHKLFTAYTPLWLFQSVLGQMPFRLKKEGDAQQLYFYFVFSKRSIQIIIYGIAFTFFLLTYIGITWGAVIFFIDNIGHLNHDEYDPIAKNKITVPLEKTRMRDILVPAIALWGLMTVTGAGFVTVFLKAGSFVEYFNYWNTVVQIMDIDPTRGVRAYFIKENIFAGTILAVFVADFCTGFFPQFPGGPGRGFTLASTFVNLFLGSFRLGLYYDHEWYWHHINQSHVTADPNLPEAYGTEIIPVFCISLFVVIYGILGSRCQTLPFIFFSQLLANASAVWNERLKNTLASMEKNKTKQSLRRLDFVSLLKDHLVLVRLYKMTEYRFSVVVISSYMVNIFCIILESYYVINILLQPLTSPVVPVVVIWNVTRKKYQAADPKFRIDPAHSLSEDEKHRNYYERLIIFALIFVLLVYQSIVTYQITSQGAKAYENAMHGFNVLRRHGFMYCTTPTERNLIHSLVFSFARNNPMILTGGGYFPIQRTLIAGIMATMINFVIFVYQYKPDDWKELEFKFGDPS